jgi:hypothetical protein
MLENLLQTIFDRDALKKFLGAFDDGEEMRCYLPGGSASWQSTAASAAEELLRRGYGEHAAFWEALVAARPHQRHHIINVMRHYLPFCELSALPPRLKHGLGRSASRRGLVAGLLVGLMGVSSLVLAAVFVSGSESVQRAREAWALPTSRIPPPRTPKKISPDVETMLHESGLAQSAFTRGDFYKAHEHIHLAQAAATRSKDGDIEPSNHLLHLHNLASILERKALVEDKLGAREAARETRVRAIVWYEKAVLHSQGDLEWLLILAQAHRRVAVNAVQNEDVDGASQALAAAVRVLERSPHIAAGSTAHKELTEVKGMRHALKLHVTSLAPGNSDPSFMKNASPSTDCRGWSERGEAALAERKLLVADDAFGQALVDCQAAEEAGDTVGLVALASLWDDVSDCWWAVDSDDPEIRESPREAANERLGESVDPRAPMWVAASWNRAETQLQSCLDRAAEDASGTAPPANIAELAGPAPDPSLSALVHPASSTIADQE